MSEHRVVVALIAACVLASSLAAQPDPALVARRDALRARGKALWQEVQALEAAARDSALTAEVQANGIRMRTTEALRPVAADALTQAVSEAHRLLGAEADSLSGRLRFTLRERRSSYRRSSWSLGGNTVSPTASRITGAYLEGTIDGRDLPGMTLDAPVARDELATNVMNLVERAMAGRLSAPIEPWLNHRVPLRESQREPGPELYRTLATNNAAVVRRCVAGDRAACRLGFALDSLPADRVAAWYDASDLPALARVAGDPNQRGWVFQSIGRDAQDACVTLLQPDACRRMLALLPADAFRVPMPDPARASLTRFALETGGPLAITRLRTSGASTIGGQLAAAAGVSVDEMLSRWMARVVAARPVSPLPSATFVLASLACIAVCAAWAMRGQPWK